MSKAFGYDKEVESIKFTDVRFPTTIRGRIDLAHIMGLAISFFLMYLDKTFFGVGFFFTMSGLLSMVAFVYNTKPLWMSFGGEIISKWLFQNYSDRAMNLGYGLISLIIGIATTIKGFE